MSRRPPNPAADRAAQNQLTLKTLVKIESNKSCADCKRNKHPRWASWNLGIFVCIRCSGIHRGMGTHISRVKSVDLDAWTDEQLQSMVRWGNDRANKYWEAKLAPGHVPAEAKIENFIRTKYDSKRWVMEGGIPDPATLDTDREEQVPAEAVQVPPKVDSSATLRAPPRGPASAPPTKPARQIDLFGEEPVNVSNTPAFTPSSSKPTPPPKPDTTAPRQPKPADSLLGFDFFGSTQVAPPSKPASAATGQVNSTSRPDLKQSILSLYASSSRTSTPTPAQSTGTGSSGYPTSSAFSPPPQSTRGGLDDAFASLSFGTSAVSAPPKFSTSNNFASPPPQSHSSAHTNPIHPNTSVARGNFFDVKPPSNFSSSPTTTNRQRGLSSSSGGFGDFTSATSPGWAPPPQTGIANSSNLHSNVQNTPAHSAIFNPTASVSSNILTSPFNLSTTSDSTQQQMASRNVTSKPASIDPWGSSAIWASSNPTVSATNPPSKATSTTAVSSDAWGWGEGRGNSNNSSGTVAVPSQPPQITGDEDFGGWESSAPPSSTAQTKQSNGPASKPAGGFSGGGEDLFSNVWE